MPAGNKVYIEGFDGVNFLPIRVDSQGNPSKGLTKYPSMISTSLVSAVALTSVTVIAAPTAGSSIYLTYINTETDTAGTVFTFKSNATTLFKWRHSVRDNVSVPFSYAVKLPSATALTLDTNATNTSVFFNAYVI